MRRMSCSAVEGPKGERCETRLVEIEKRKKEGPSWDSFRSRIFSMARSGNQTWNNMLGTRSPSGTPTSRSPVSSSPLNRSPGSRSPASRSPSSRSPTCRSPASRSPASRSPARSPTRNSCIRTPVQSPVTPMHRSPSGGSPPTHINFQIQKRRGSRGSRESLSGPDTPTAIKPPSRRESPTTETPSGSKGRRGRLRTFSLSLEGSETGSISSSLESPITPSGPGGRKVQLKIRANSAVTPSGGPAAVGRGSPEHLIEMTQLDDERNIEAAANRPRKWSYHGTASPSAPVDIPKRHSFSTGSEQPHGLSGTMSGIVVSNTDLLSLLQPSQLLAFPGLADLKQFRTVMPRAPPTYPKSRGRSQSIAVCAQSAPLLPLKAHGAPLIRTTDCDHEASLLARTSTLEDQAEESEADDIEDKKADKLIWDSSGSTVDVGLLGSVIESYLKTSTEDESEENPSRRDSSEGLAPPVSRLQVK